MFNQGIVLRDIVYPKRGAQISSHIKLGSLIKYDGTEKKALNSSKDTVGLEASSKVPADIKATALAPYPTAPFESGSCYKVNVTSPL